MKKMLGQISVPIGMVWLGWYCGPNWKEQVYPRKCLTNFWSNFHCNGVWTGSLGIVV